MIAGCSLVGQYVIDDCENMLALKVMCALELLKFEQQETAVN